MGLTEGAGAAFVRIAAASPEIGINTTSVIRGVSDIGLGVMFGSNILAIPLVITTAYWASRAAKLGNGDAQKGQSSDDSESGEGQR